jgi:GTP-binding protein
MKNRLPMVAIVGRVNVGKSTLFNRFLGTRMAIEHRDAGVTRDNNYKLASFDEKQVLLVDTGGFSWQRDSGLESEIRKMAQAASNEADVVLLLVDASVGPTDEDVRLARLLQRGGSNVILVGNKADRPEAEAQRYAFLSLGLGEPILCSAVHGQGVREVVDSTLAALPTAAADELPAGVRVAIVGKPNVGKSSLVNALVGENRVIVHEKPGTTRDAVDVWLEKRGKAYHLVDTAGFRRPARVDEPIEYYSVLRALRAINRCQVCVLVLDASEAVARQDARIGSLIAQSFKAAVVVANKWDLVRDDDYRAQRFSAERERRLSFLSYTPFLQISALKGTRVARVLPAAYKVYQAAAKRVDTGPLNRFLQRLMQVSPPPSYRGKEVSIRYGSQVNTEPPTFVLHTNRPWGVPIRYRRFLARTFREQFDFVGTPVRIVIRGT